MNSGDAARGFILLVEDNYPDEEILREWLKEQVHPPLVECLHDGVAALEFLRQEAGAPADRPSLILLDLNLPGRGGLEVLKAIKSHPRFKSVPTIVVSSSKAPQDIEKSYAHGANAYVPKSLDLEEYFQALNRLYDFWFKAAVLPE